MAENGPYTNLQSESPTSQGPGNGIPPRTHSSSLQPSDGISSDNDASEGPVREKLKKTSIASMPRDNETSTSLDMIERQAESDKVDISVPEPFVTNKAPDADTQVRGRLSRKRSFEVSIGDNEIQSTNYNTVGTRSEGRERKRSKDVHAGQISQVDTTDHGSARSPVPEEGEADGALEILRQARQQRGSDNHDDEVSGQPVSEEGPAEYDLANHPFGPRKKRSRDPLDTDLHREQKIVATEEAKANRRSDEYDREVNNPSVTMSDLMTGAENPRASINKGSDTLLNKADQNSGFFNTSVSSPFASLARPQRSMEPLSNPTIEDTASDSITSSSAFAASGFAALSKSTISPFGSMAPSALSSTRTFGSPAAIPEVQVNNSFGEPQSSKPDNLGSSGTSTLSATPSGMASSPFGSVGMASAGSHGMGNTFGSNFSGNGFAGARLNSFAAPGADTTWGGSGSIQPLGTTSARRSDDEHSESEGDHEESNSNDMEDSERDSRFQQHVVDTGEEGEHTVFISNRANLYAFEGSWKERGRGIFKLNIAVTASEESDSTQRKGRFIMRAHQTYRVLLNTPIFKQMQVGDSKGQEPKGKQVSLAVIEGGKPTPYLLKLADDNEARTLYGEVRKFQKGLQQ